MKPERVGGVKCFTRLLDRNTTRKNLYVGITDISITCSLGMGVAIQKTYEEGLWYGRSHPAEETMMIRGVVAAILKDSGMGAAIHQWVM